jgi:serine/threonine protein kinase
MIGTFINQYQITAALGAGGMGEVFRARDTRLHREVAIKVLPKAFAADADRLRRFEQESKTLAALNHPNVLTVYDAGVHEGAPYLVSELLEGQTLRELLAASNKAPVPLRKASGYALQIAHGLAAAHSKGIIHRDLKPENIFITKDGRIKILDFGIAKLTPVAADVRRLTSSDSSSNVPPDKVSLLTSAATEPGLVLGTPAYMSPEQVRGQPADHRSDIFAFGCVLYEMLTGAGAFRRDTPVESMNAVLREETPDLTTTHAGIPLSMDRVVRRCLEKEPERRFQSASDLAFALEGADSTVLSGNLVGTRSTRIPGEMRRGWNASLPRVLPWAVAVVCLAALAASLFFRKPDPKPLAVARSTTLVRKFELQLASPGRPQSDGTISPAISPDGLKIAYATADGLWLRRLDRLSAPVRLVEDKQIVRPFWSPGSTDIGYFQGPKLARVSVEGGRPITITPIPDHQGQGGAEGGAWLDNDRIVFASGNSGLNLVPSQGGAVKALWEPNLAAGDRDVHGVAALPEGAGVVFLIHRTTNETADTMAVWTKAGAHKILLQKLGAQFRDPFYSPTGHILFSQIGDVQGIWAFAFSLERMERTEEPFRVAESGSIPSVSNDGTLVCFAGPDPIFAPRQLVWVDRTGKVLGTVGPVLPTLTAPRLSPDEHRVAALSGESYNSLQVWVIDVDGGGALPITHDQEPHVSPHWAPDSRSVYFTRFRSSIDSTWIASADGTGSEQRRFDGDAIPSASGKYMLLRENSTNPPIQRPWTYVQLPKTNASPIPLVEVFGSIRSLVLSADDRWLAFSSSSSGQQEVWAAEFPGLNNRVMASRGGGGRNPLWARNRQELFYLSADGRAMMSARLEPDQPRFDPPVKVFDIPDKIFTDRVAVYDVAGDGQRFLMLQKVADPTDHGAQPNVLLVENWFEEHRRR